MRWQGELLVVAGEPSGDGLAARVVAELGAPSFGLGGTELGSAGTELVAEVGSAAAMGLSAPLASAPALVRALLALARAVQKRRPRAALLVGFSEVNARLAPWLRRRHVRVVWYAPPQVWAWRRGRAARIARTVDRLAVLLPFEPDVWRRAGGRAEYVGHPALDPAMRARRAKRATSGPPLVALLPGSRKQELLAHLPPMLDAVSSHARRSGVALDARVILSRALPAEARKWARRAAGERGVAVSTDPIELSAAEAHAAIVSSGTATLECAALRVPPVIVYRTDRVTHFVAKRLVRVPSIGLPNLILGRPVFPELVQTAVTAGHIWSVLQPILNDPAPHLAACDETLAQLSEGLGAGTAAERVARMVEPWLS